MLGSKIYLQQGTLRIVLLLFFLSCRSFAQISPGPLSQPHAHLEGLTKCLTCHEVGKQTSNAKCLKCHVAIAERLQDQRGFHATVMAREKSKPCASCHSEHNGVNFALIFWEKGEANFDHKQAGFVLEGKHAKTACRACHQPDNIQEKFTNDPNVSIAKTFLGLSQKCLSCHADEHRGQLANACERCHDFAGWKPAAKFSHNHAKFVLTGKHQSVPCAKCHPAKSTLEKAGNEPPIFPSKASSRKVGAFVQYTGLQFSNCIPCHQDPHRGGFGNDCVKCHTTEDWKRVTAGAFNHDLTDFPLRGKHRSVKCEQCHVGGDFKKKLAHQFCRDCHQDAHAGQFARRAGQGGCESCHTVEGFVPSQFALAEHQKSAFPLSGGHLAVPCGVCHTRQTSGKFAGKLLFVFPDRRCQACHQDVHAGQFVERMAKSSCDLCHVNESWHQTRFDHNTARFALAGTHQKVACGKCHPKENANANTAFIQSPKNGQSKKKDPSLPEGFIRYRPLAFRCVDCHQDIHRGQFGKKDQVHCEKCHQPTLWSGLLFVHNRDSAFKLDGAHEKVACEKCHFPLVTKQQIAVVIYKPLRKECAACHR
jgi:hypothetical protein